MSEITLAFHASEKLAETLGYAPLRDVEIDGAAARLMARKGPPV